MLVSGRVRRSPAAADPAGILSGSLGSVPHTIEPASSGRAKCRGCGRPIPKGELRLGERLPNPFADEGDMTLWFHLRCGAYKRPEVLLEALASTEAEVPGRKALEAAARRGVEHRRLPRLDGAERSPTDRATCRSCREPIARDSWRLRLVFYEDGRFAPSGFVHAGCAAAYLGTAELLERLEDLDAPREAAERAALAEALAAPPATPGG